ncbi:hypothetical protein ABTM92_19600, partial [Acinetobacter baumannii]
MNAPATFGAEADTDAAPHRKFPLPRRAISVGAIAVLIAVLGTLWLLAPRSSESTDNAYLRADSSSVAPKV